MAVSIKALPRLVEMLETKDIKYGYYLPHIIYATEFDSQYTAGTTYVQKFRVEIGGLLDTRNNNNAVWEHTPIHAEGAIDAYESGSMPSSLFDFVCNNNRYVEAGSILTVKYKKLGSSAFKLARAEYWRVVRDPGTQAVTSATKITEAVINGATLMSLIESNFSSDGLHVSGKQWDKIPVTDVISAITYNDIQTATDEVRFNIEPRVFPEITLGGNESRNSSPQLRITNMVDALAEYGMATSFSLSSNNYDDWTDIGNGLEAKGRFIYEADYFYLVNNGWSVFVFDGGGRYRSAPSWVAYSEGTSYPVYWPYYANALKSYCKQKIDTANANGAHYNALTLRTSKSSTVANSVWKIIITSSTSGEDNIEIDNISYASISSMFGTGGMQTSDIILKGRGFSYTYSTDFIYTLGSETITHPSVRITDVDAAIEEYGVLEKFTLETEDYPDWTDLGTGIEVKGFFVEGYHCMVLIGEPEWKEYPELGIKIKAKHANLLQAKDLIVPINTICSNGNYGWDYFVKRDGYVRGKFKAKGYIEPYGYIGLPHFNPSTEVPWRINGSNRQTNSINSSTDGILIPTAEYEIYARKAGGTFNKLGTQGWRYMRNGSDISDDVSFNADDYFSEHLYSEEGIVEEHVYGTGVGAGTGFPSDFQKQPGDTLVLDVECRGSISRTLTDNINRYDFFDVRLHNGVTLTDLFGVTYGNNSKYYALNTQGQYTTKVYGNYWTFDFNAYMANHPEVFPTTIRKKTVRFTSVNGSYGEEVDALLSGVTIGEGDYFEFEFIRPYCYGDNLLYEGYLQVDRYPDTNGWYEHYYDAFDIIGVCIDRGDMVIIQPIDGSGGEDPDNQDIPTPDDYVTITFDAETNGGTCSMYQYRRARGTAIGVLPDAYKLAHKMTGWFTQPEGGGEVRYNTIVNNDMTVYAQFIESIDESELRKYQFPYIGSGLTHDVLIQTRPITLDQALGNTFRVVVRGYFRNPQENGSDKHLGLYVLGSYDYKNWQLYGWKEKRLSDAGFHDIGCETYRASMKYIMVILTGQLADGSHIDKIDMTGIGRYNNKLK